MMDIASDLVKLELRSGGRIAVLTIDNPPVNALSKAVRSEFLHTLNKLRADVESGSLSVRMIVIRGANGKFSAGADLKNEMLPALREALADYERNQFAPLYSLLREGHDFVDAVASFPLPTIAVVEGFALGGGCELTLACDDCILVHGAKIGLPEITLDLLPGWGGTIRSADDMGEDAARELYMSGTQLSCEEAVVRGLASGCFDNMETIFDILEALFNALEQYNVTLSEKCARALTPEERTREIEAFYHQVRSVGDAEWKIVEFLNKKKNPSEDPVTGYLMAGDGTVLLARPRKNHTKLS